MNIPTMAVEEERPDHVGNAAFAATTAKTSMDRAPGEVSAIAAYLEVMNALGREADSSEAARRLDDLIPRLDGDLPVFRRMAAAKTARPWTAGVSGELKDSSSAGEGRDVLAKLGPFAWTPRREDDFSLPDTEGRPWTLADHRGRFVLALFYLGEGCAPCLKQLREFGKATEEFASMGVDVVAIGTDGPDATRSLKLNPEGISFPMPLLSDPSLATFRTYRAFDDFEGAPLHGAILIDPKGLIRWSRVSAEPFLDIDFLKSEAKRVGRMGR